MQRLPEQERRVHVRCAHRRGQCHPFSRRAINHRMAQAAARADSVNRKLTTMYALSCCCKAQFKNTTHSLWISEQSEKSGIRADGDVLLLLPRQMLTDCDPVGGACDHVVKVHLLRDGAQNRPIINNELVLESNCKNRSKSYFAKDGGGAIYQRQTPFVKASEIEVTRRDLVHAEYSLKKSDCFRQMCDIGAQSCGAARASETHPVGRDRLCRQP